MFGYAVVQDDQIARHFSYTTEGYLAAVVLAEQHGYDDVWETIDGELYALVLRKRERD